MSDLNKFKNFITTVDELFEYQFQINVFTNGGEFDPNLTELKNISFYVNTTTLPGKNLERADVFHYGLNFKKPSRMVYTDTIALDMRVDADLNIHKSISQWMDSFFDIAKGGAGDRRLPQYNIKMYILDKNLNPVEGSKTIILAGVYPSNIGDINLTHEGSAIAICPVEFTYQYWYYEEDGDPLG